MAVNFHNMPQNWFTANQNQWFWLKFSFFFHSRSRPAAQNNGFHIFVSLKPKYPSQRKFMLVYIKNQAKSTSLTNGEKMV